MAISHRTEFQYAGDPEGIFTFECASGDCLDCAHGDKCECGCHVTWNCSRQRVSLATWIADRREVIALPLGIAVWGVIALGSAIIACMR